MAKINIPEEYKYKNINLNEEKEYYQQIEEKIYMEEMKNNQKKIYNKNTRKINKR